MLIKSLLWLRVAPNDRLPSAVKYPRRHRFYLGVFLQPVSGRVISGFGSKKNGLHNDGINYSVPLGTPVKAAENGVVVYAGNDLPGFGNLLLVKHANGYVTAYAHTQSFLVKQGSRVKRGQVIAKSGKSGNVVEPQLHFEIRQGSRAINPQKLLT